MYRRRMFICYQKRIILGYTCSRSSMMSRDFVTELKELNNANVHIRNKNEVNRLIDEIISGGTKKLQVVSDFDRTITKQHENGKAHLSSFGIFARCSSLPKSYLEAEQLLNSKYLPIEVDPNIPFNDKKALMEEWWNLSEKLLVGLKVPEKDINEVVAEVGPSLRDHCIESFNVLYEAQVPVLVFSAGLGDAVVAVLKHCKVLLPNVKVISNFLKRNQDGFIEGFNGKMINVFNKNEVVLHGTEYSETIKDRGNIILMGDSLGDVNMADGVQDSNAVLKIGFLYDHVDGNLPGYMDKFDIVLEDDQTMNVLNALLRLIIT